MGLDCSHDAWHGAYSAFNRFRQAITASIGGSFPPHKDIEKHPEHDMIYWDEEKFDMNNYPGLFEFLSHSDCDGEISPGMCFKVASDLVTILPRIELLCPNCFKSVGHIKNMGGFIEATKTFIKGCRKAHAAGEPLLFR